MAYNHNKHNLSPGDIVQLDKTHPNTSRVKIVGFSPMKMYANVISVNMNDETIGSAWDTMTNRLSPLKPGSPAIQEISEND